MVAEINEYIFIFCEMNQRRPQLRSWKFALTTKKIYIAYNRIPKNYNKRGQMISSAAF